MTNIIEYLLMFIVTAMFISFNYYVAVYYALSFIILLIYVILFFKRKDKNKNLKIESKYSFWVAVIFIVLANLIVKLEIANFVFGILYVLYFLLMCIVKIKKKEDIFGEKLVNSKNLYDIYVIIYLVTLLVKIS